MYKLKQCTIYVLFIMYFSSSFLKVSIRGRGLWLSLCTTLYVIALINVGPILYL